MCIICCGDSDWQTAENSLYKYIYKNTFFIFIFFFLSQNVVSRVSNLPLVSSACEKVSSTYTSTKDSIPLLKGVMDAAESGVRTLGAAATTGSKPLLDIMEPQRRFFLFYKIWCNIVFNVTTGVRSGHQNAVIWLDTIHPSILYTRCWCWGAFPSWHWGMKGYTLYKLPVDLMLQIRIMWSYTCKERLFFFKKNCQHLVHCKQELIPTNIIKSDELNQLIKS